MLRSFLLVRLPNRRRTLSLISSTAVLFAATTGHADPTLKVGAGVRSCAQFRRDYQANPELVEALYFTWAQGYLSGASLFSSDGEPTVDLLPEGHTEQSQREYLREFCQKKPLSPFSEGVATLFLELLKLSQGK